MTLISHLLPFCPLKIKDNLISIWKSVDIQPALSSHNALQCSCLSFPVYIRNTTSHRGLVGRNLFAFRKSLEMLKNQHDVNFNYYCD